MAQTERELADAAQTVDGLEKKLDTVSAELRKVLALLDASREHEQERTISLTEVRERLGASKSSIRKQKRLQNSTGCSRTRLYTPCGRNAGEQGTQHAEEMKTRQRALEQAQNAASDARESKAVMTGELQALKAHNDQLAALLTGKAEPKAKAEKPKK